MANGVLRVVPEGELQRQEQETARQKVESETPTEIKELAQFVRAEFHAARDSRHAVGISDRLMASLRTYKGEYSDAKLSEISKFGGTKVYSKSTTTKCRGATAVLRDLFLSVSKRPWDLKPTPTPTTPDDITANVLKLVQQEVQQSALQGTPIQDEQVVHDRITQLMEAAQAAAIKKAYSDAEKASRTLNDRLVEGNYYNAIREFLVDLPIFPLACIKGPVVRNVTKTRWVEGQPQQTTEAILWWQRVSPLDLYFTPDASCLDQSHVIEHVRYTRDDLYQLIGLPGFDEDAIRLAIEEFKHGQQSQDWRDWFETEREKRESRDHWQPSRGKLIDGVEYHGEISGRMLRDFGFDEEKVPDIDKDYPADIWMVDRHVIKAQINPNPKRRKPYYITSFEKVPGSIWGYGLPDILEDIQSVMNATLRALVNNLSIASGPQVVVNMDLMDPLENPDELFPWKRWKTINDPLGMKGSGKPVDFFQPTDNSTNLMNIYQQLSTIADEVSAIPRYMTGSTKVGGAGRTASGLAMLMENSNTVLQDVARNIDYDVMEPSLEDLYDMMLLTQKEPALRGDESIRVRGVTLAMQKETDRMRRLEFLQLTGNPIDMSIIGVDGRAKILRNVSDTLGMEGEDIVPSEDLLMARQQQQQQQQQVAAQPGGNEPAPEDERAPAEQVRQPFENATRGMV